MKMKNELKARMLAGERTLGTFFETGSATAAECLGLAGLDYIIIDTEHGSKTVWHHTSCQGI